MNSPKWSHDEKAALNRRNIEPRKVPAFRRLLDIVIAIHPNKTAALKDLRISSRQYADLNEGRLTYLNAKKIMSAYDQLREEEGCSEC